MSPIAAKPRPRDRCARTREIAEQVSCDFPAAELTYVNLEPDPERSPGTAKQVAAFALKIAATALSPRHDDARFDRLRHFIWTFHDSTFECLAEGLEIG